MNEQIQSNFNDVSQEVRQDYADHYAPKVHTIGRTTMVIALFLSFLPVIFLYFVKGYQLPVAHYLNVAFSITAFCIGFWIAEPLSWFPILGAASSYMGYLAGNVKNVRVPIARALQSTYKTNVNSPRGQIIITIGVAISVFVNLFILSVVVIAGSYIVPMLPPVILRSLSYVIPALVGALLAFRICESGVKTTLEWAIPGIVIFTLMKVTQFPLLVDFGMSLSVLVSILVGYVRFRVEGRNEQESGTDGQG